MADPSSFAVGNAPGGASYSAPLLNFSALANAPQTIFEAQQRATLRRYNMLFRMDWMNSKIHKLNNMMLVP